MQSESNAIAERIGENIRGRRESLLYSLEELARRADLQEHTLWRIERGTIMPSVLNLVHVADVLECRPGDLLQGVSAAMGDEAR